MPVHEDKKNILVYKAAGGKKVAGNAGRRVQRVPTTLGVGPGQVSARPGCVADKEVAFAGKQCGMLLAKGLKHHRRTTERLCKKSCKDAPRRGAVEAEPEKGNGGNCSSMSTLAGQSLGWQQETLELALSRQRKQQLVGNLARQRIRWQMDRCHLVAAKALVESCLVPRPWWRHGTRAPPSNLARRQRQWQRLWSWQRKLRGKCNAWPRRCQRRQGSKLRAGT